MGHRVTWRGRPQCDLPFNYTALVNVAAVDKTGWVGPISLRQLIEIFWRVKEIRITGSIEIDFTYLDTAGPGPPYIRITGSCTHEIDQTFVKESDKGEPPIFTYGESDEIDVFRDNLHLGGFGWWRDGPGTGGDLIEILTNEVRKENDQYWLRPFFQLSPYTNSSTVPNAVLAHGDDIQYGSGGKHDYALVTASWTIAGIVIDFPMLWHAFEYLSGDLDIDSVVITASSATIEALQWFPYKTTAGVDAWDTSTGLPINDGPGA